MKHFKMKLRTKLPRNIYFKLEERNNSIYVNIVLYVLLRNTYVRTNFNCDRCVYRQKKPMRSSTEAHF